MRKGFLLIVILICLFLGCTRQILLPEDDRISIKRANVEVVFDFAVQEISVHNRNWNRAGVLIQRKTDGVYLTIFEARVGGRKSVHTKAYFDHGDETRTTIKVEGKEWIDYFTLGY